MQAQDVMTTHVITVQPETAVGEVAKLMVDHRISGIPVQDAHDRLVGIVTDGDIYRRAELGTEKARESSWLELFTGEDRSAADYVAAHGSTVGDVMTTDVVAVTPNAALAQIADVFETRRIRRVPVIKDGKIVGIVSRANLVQALVASPEPENKDEATDRRIRDLLLAEYARRSWGMHAEGNVIVQNGTVHVWGLVGSDAERDALRLVAEAIPGVKGFEDQTIRYLGDIGARPRIDSKVTVIGADRTD